MGFLLSCRFFSVSAVHVDPSAAVPVQEPDQLRTQHFSEDQALQTKDPGEELAEGVRAQEAWLAESVCAPLSPG